MTRTEIKQAADTARNGLPKHIHRSVVIIAADELIDKLEADKAKLRDVAEQALDTLRCCCISAGGIDDRATKLRCQSELGKALKDTSDE